MGSLNHIKLPQTSESPSPSSAFESCDTVDIEISTLVNKTEAESEDNENGRLPDVVVEAKMLGEDEGQPLQETYFSIAIQVFIPFLIAGLGMVFAGLVLDRIQVSQCFEFQGFPALLEFLYAKKGRGLPVCRFACN